MGSGNSGQGHRRPSGLKVGRLIADFLDEAVLLQVATAAGGEPWICTVSFASDEDMNLYWLSRHDTRHSHAIARAPWVAGAVVGPHRKGDKSRGLQIQGTAGEVLQDPYLHVGLLAMQRRYDVPPERTAELRRLIRERSGDFGLYRLEPERIVLCDKLNFPDAPWQEYVPAKRSSARR